ncbi:TetR/AcrR family transcriptional regulator [Micromonospora endophytica]|uniref:TetR family transcriptional regulator n=1 Tax=Micromonospora endophytica TaxID=515350 RepID=A0A2W2D9A3_9ACTN|nr:TetR family transcriptional regulator [Micromonospora endophytica]RIW43360.1 TetR/AcrR family transcriptional regulator [Micromonospora endophytica]BCJ58778.1 TetR family transcriptional regulator [Micromonospora endophytica]
MVRLTRAQQQERTRAAVLAAAVQEFTEHGYADAKVDRIAARAELTRGAVYSNFPSKRSLYLAVLLDSLPGLAATGTTAVAPAGPVDVAGGAEAFARVRLERLPLAGDPAAASKLRCLSLTGVFDDEPGRTALAEVTRLESLLLAIALESCRARDTSRRVRLAELILTLLDGAAHLAQTAPGFGDPFDVARACRHLAGLDADDTWDPPHLPFVAAAQQCHDAWTPPEGLRDEITGGPPALDADGLIVVLGTGRLGAAEEAVRAARPRDAVTVAVVTTDPAESGALVRLRILDIVACLRRVFGPAFTPTLRLVLDERAALAAALDIGATEQTEAAVRLRAGHIVARSHGRGAAYAAATALVT